MGSGQSECHLDITVGEWLDIKAAVKLDAGNRKLEKVW